MPVCHCMLFQSEDMAWRGRRGTCDGNLTEQDRKWIIWYSIIVTHEAKNAGGGLGAVVVILAFLFKHIKKEEGWNTR